MVCCLTFGDCVLLIVACCSLCVARCAVLVACCLGRGACCVESVVCCCVLCIVCRMSFVGCWRLFDALLLAVLCVLFVGCGVRVFYGVDCCLSCVAWCFLFVVRCASCVVR